MKVPFMYIITASLMAVSATSQAIENCPKISNIEQVGPGILNRPGFSRHLASSLRDAFQTLPVTADC